MSQALARHELGMNRHARTKAYSEQGKAPRWALDAPDAE